MRFGQHGAVVFWLGLGVIGTGGSLSAQPVATVGELLDGVLGQPAEVQNYFVIPVAGHVEGYRNTEFRTDVTALAGGGGSHRVAVAWLAQDIDSSAQPLAFFEVGPGPAFFADMAATAVGKTGLGALVVAAVTADGSLDPAARLAGFARAWTPVPGCVGTSSLTVAPSSLTTAWGFADGLLLDSWHRGTVGIVNPTRQSRTFTVGGSGDQFKVSVPAASMRQVALPWVGGGSAWVEVAETDDSCLTTPTSNCGFAAYAASIDEGSGDGWLVTLR